MKKTVPMIIDTALSKYLNYFFFFRSNTKLPTPTNRLTAIVPADIPDTAPV